MVSKSSFSLLSAFCKLEQVRSSRTLTAQTQQHTLHLIAGDNMMKPQSCMCHQPQVPGLLSAVYVAVDAVQARCMSI